MEGWILSTILNCVLLASAFAQVTNLRSEKELFAIENSFSRDSESKGFRAANLLYAADDAVVFRPLEINAKEWSRQLKDTTFITTWSPSFLEISAAGDLGFATGPFETRSTVAGENKITHGQFATVWKKQPDGTWKFIMDFGSGTLPETEAMTKEPVYRPGVEKESSFIEVNQKEEWQKVLDIEAAFSTECQSQGDLSALNQYAEENIHFFYQREFYTHDLKQVAIRIKNQNGRHIWNPTKGTVARSGDLAHVYGTHQFIDGNSIREGYYMRIWKRQMKGDWKIALQVRNLVDALPR